MFQKWIEIKKKGDVDLNVLYKKMIPWFEKNKYLFTEKELSNETKSDGQDQVLKWNGFRKIDDYFKFVIDVELWIYRWKGKRAEVTIRFKWDLEKDYRGKFRSRYGEFMKNLYEKLIIREKIDKMEFKLAMEQAELVDIAKKILAMKRR